MSLLFCSISLCFLALSTEASGKLSTATSATSVESLRLDIIHGLSSDPGGDVDSLETALEQALALVKDTRAAQLQTLPVAVIGGGLSGLTASLRLLEAGFHVVLVDKRDFLGGNSAKASSGINGCKTDNQNKLGIDDSANQFYNDTMKCSGRMEGTLTERLVRRMTDDSENAVKWIESRSGVDLPDVGQLGGHSAARTHRPRKRLAGAAFISGLERAVLKYKNSGRLELLKGHKLVKLSHVDQIQGGLNEKDGGVWDLDLERNSDSQMVSSRVGTVILATGGYANDKVGSSSLLKEVAPHLMHLRSTNGEFATGDGIKLARDIGAGTIDLDMVQVHPTGFSDTPTGFKDTGNVNSPLTLCAEILRGVGGVLLDSTGSRFANELDTRKNVVARMNATGEEKFVIALPPQAAPKVPAHINIYKGKGLLHPVEGVAGVAEFVKARLGGEAEMIEETFKTTSAQTHKVARTSPTNLPSEGIYHVGVVQPVLHYTMGGLAVDEEGRVMGEDMQPISGLYAAGEIMGGVHGENRLGGSSLLDCVVFGLASANSIISNAPTPVGNSATKSVDQGSESESTSEDLITYEDAPVAPDKQLRVKVQDKWYDLSRFVDLHPGGALIVENGEDLTKRFTESHGDDWELFSRDEVTEVTEDGLAIKHSGGKKEQKVHRTANYGGVGGSWREILGRRAWFFLHSVAAKYPDNPTENDKTSLRNLVAALGQHYPCKLCRKHLKQQLRDPDLGPVAVNSRQELTVWFCELHNMVNRDIGKKEFDCNPFNLDMMYLKDCGECEHTTKKDVPPEVALAEERTKPGYHPPSGPWDSSLYQRDPLLLQSVKSVTDAFDAKEADDLLNAMRILGAVNAKDIEGIRGAIRKSPDQLGDWLDILAKSGEVARKAIVNDPTYSSFSLLSKESEKENDSNVDEEEEEEEEEDDDDDDDE